VSLQIAALQDVRRFLWSTVMRRESFYAIGLLSKKSFLDVLLRKTNFRRRQLGEYSTPTITLSPRAAAVARFHLGEMVGRRAHLSSRRGDF
jgi:hypothetical protein